MQMILFYGIAEMNVESKEAQGKEYNLFELLFLDIYLMFYLLVNITISISPSEMGYIFIHQRK